MPQPRIDSIKIKMEHDTDPYHALENLGTWSDTPEEGAIDVRPMDANRFRYFNPAISEYAKENLARIRAYERGEWYVHGVSADAVVSYPEGEHIRRLTTFTSGSIGGVESDSDDAYIHTLAEEQLADLRDHLAVFGVNLDNFGTLAKEALDNL